MSKNRRPRPHSRKVLASNQTEEGNSMPVCDGDLGTSIYRPDTSTRHPDGEWFSASYLKPSIDPRLNIEEDGNLGLKFYKNLLPIFYPFVLQKRLPATNPFFVPAAYWAAQEIISDKHPVAGCQWIACADIGPKKLGIYPNCHQEEHGQVSHACVDAFQLCWHFEYMMDTVESNGYFGTKEGSHSRTDLGQLMEYAFQVGFWAARLYSRNSEDLARIGKASVKGSRIGTEKRTGMVSGKPKEEIRAAAIELLMLHQDEKIKSLALKLAERFTVETHEHGPSKEMRAWSLEKLLAEVRNELLSENFKCIVPTCNTTFSQKKLNQRLCKVHRRWNKRSLAAAGCVVDGGEHGKYRT